MAELYLFPDERVVIQAAVYVIGLASAHHFIVKPLLSLHLERLKRSTGAVAGAQSEQNRIEVLEKQYTSQLTAARNEANDLRNKEVLAGQASASEIIASAQNIAKEKLDQFRADLEVQVQQERAQLKQTSKTLAAAIIQKLSSAIIVCSLLVSAFFGEQASAAGGGPVDFWYGIFWPTFQFALFLLGMWYFGRGPVEKILEAKRDKLRTQLSEARQSVQVAERKIAEYEAKIARLKADIDEIRKVHADEGLRQRNELIEEANKLKNQILQETEKRQNEILAGARDALKKDLIDQAIVAVQNELSGAVLQTIESSLKSKALDLTRLVH